MERKYKGRIWFLISTVVLTMLIVLWLSEREMIAEELILRIQFGESQTELKGWRDEDSNVLCFFLPSGAEKICWGIGGNNRKYYQDGVLLADGAPCLFDLEEEQQIVEYSLFGLIKRPCQVRFLQSSDVASVWIHTGSGKMDYIYREKGNEESGEALFLDADGVTEYEGGLASLRGRGNYTWLLDKKSFSMTLEETADLFFSEPDDEWVLLASASEGTHLITRMVFELMRQAGIEAVPYSGWVDLYLNGEYAGNYLLAQKVKMPEQYREKEGAWMIEFDGYWREEGTPGFQTQAGELVSICYPEQPALQEQETIETFVQRAENAALSPDGRDSESGLYWQELVDADSVVKKYVLDEISKCPDGWNGSNYCYLREEKLYFAAPWDYEFSFGNQPSWFSWLIVPDGFYHKDATSWYQGLYQKKEFREAVVSVYKTYFRPYLLAQMDYGIEEAAELIAGSMEMDALRWGIPDDLFMEKVKELSTYIKERLDWLDSEWLGYPVPEATPYYILRLMDEGEEYAVYHIREGDIIQEEMLLREDANFTGWYEDPEATVPADLTKAVYENITLYSGWNSSGIRAQLITNMMPLMLLLLVLAIWMVRTLLAILQK